MLSSLASLRSLGDKGFEGRREMVRDSTTLVAKLDLLLCLILDKGQM